MSRLKPFFRDERGATAIEYGLIAGLIAVVIITGATLTGDTLDEQFTAISTALNPAPEAPAEGG